MRRLNFFDKVRLYNLIHSIDTEEKAKIFISSFYDINDLPDDFYSSFLYNAQIQKNNEFINIVSKKDIYCLISYFKFDNKVVPDIPSFISPKTYYDLSAKQINYLSGLLKKIHPVDNSIELKKIFHNNPNWLLRQTTCNVDEEFDRIAIKMLLSIGLDNSIDLINGKYGKIDYEMVYYLFNKLDFRNGNINNPIFNEFLFGNKKAYDNTIRLMLCGELLEIFLHFDILYNSINFFTQKLGKKLNKNKVNLILKERLFSLDIENPEISGDIVEDMISSYRNEYGFHYNDEIIIQKNIEAYESKLKQKTKSSIIYMELDDYNGFSFELLPIADPRNLVIGYRTGNCFRLNGKAFILFDKFLTSPHMRVLSISNEEYKDLGMVLLMRNGNVLIAQGIELSSRVINHISGLKLYDGVRKSIESIMNKMNEEGDEIVASIIGLSNNNTLPYNTSVLPFLIGPISDSNQHYNGIYNYQGLLCLKDGKSLGDIKLFTPEKFYYDKSIIYSRNGNDSHRDINYQHIEKILVSLRFEKYKKSPEEISSIYMNLLRKKEAYTICSKDWYITMFEDGTYDSFNKSTSKNVIDEFNSQLKKVSTKKIKKKTYE